MRLSETTDRTLPDNTDVFSALEGTDESHKNQKYLKHSHQRILVEFMLGYAIYLLFFKNIMTIVKAIYLAIKKVVTKFIGAIRYSYCWLYFIH